MQVLHGKTGRFITCLTKGEENVVKVKLKQKRNKEVSIAAQCCKTVNQPDAELTKPDGRGGSTEMFRQI